MKQATVAQALELENVEPDLTALTMPKHVAIIMDGNGRWAKARHLPRMAGHKAGVESVRAVVSTAAELSIEQLTLFAFSSENWSRPLQEVKFLMGLLSNALQKEVKKLNENNIKLKIIGDRKMLEPGLISAVDKAEQSTANNSGLQLNIALNYGGRWDIVHAAKNIAEDVLLGRLNVDEINETVFAQYTQLANLPEPDLFIRTSGEMRISNFLNWQLAYTEMVFVEQKWPDFNANYFKQTIVEFNARTRRYGMTDEQLQQS